MVHESGIKKISRDFLAVQWIRLCASNAGGVGSISGQGTKIPYALWHSQKRTKEKISNIEGKDSQ